jgi:4-amino-4-deoxy-L-arabinose transferase-like glycosyltransferase
MKRIPIISPVRFFILTLLIAIPALFINLGKQPVIDDEAIRALVAMDMLESGDFITPTIAGEIYLKKPPLYNWILAASFYLTGSTGEFALRLPMALSLLAFTILIFIYYRREMSDRSAVMAALLFLTCGRILIYESLHGLIDITYSMVVFTFFMHVYFTFMNGKILRLYTIGYLLIGVAFLIKGLPSILFLGFTLLVLFVLKRKFHLLFHWGHLIGILLFIVIVGGYYLLYFSQNDVSPREMFGVVLGENTRRTAVRFGFWQTLLHLLRYPFDIIYHFLPWGFMALLLFRRGSLRQIGKDPFVRYLALVFLANILVYWISPEVYPRYILMLIPLLFGVFVFLYQEQKSLNTIQVRIIEWLYGGILSLTALAGLVPFFMDMPLETKGIYITGTTLTVLLALIAYFYWNDLANRILWMALGLLLLRIGFNLIVIPERVAESDETANRQQLEQMAEVTEGQPLKFHWNTRFEPNPYYGYRVTSYRTNYYLAQFRGQPIPLDTNRLLDPSVYYISTDYAVHGDTVDLIRKFKTPGQESMLLLFKKKVR